MTGRVHPKDLKLLVRFLRSIPDWLQAELAAAAGVDPSSIYHYEDGQTVPRRETLRQLAAAVHLHLPFVEGTLLPVIGAARALADLGTGETSEVPERLAAEIDHALAGAFRAETSLFLASLGEGWEQGPRVQAVVPSPEDRFAAQGLWEDLSSRSPEERLALVRSRPEYQTWALAERLCHESEEAASDRADRALELAELALAVAELAQGSAAWRSRLLGYVRVYLANALRVQGDLQAAARALARGWKLWKAGAPGDPDRLLPEWRLLDRTASLRRAQRRFEEALDLLARALASGPCEAAGRILLNKAFTLDQMGTAERAVETLCEAAPLIDSQRTPRLLSVLQFNLAASLCKLQRHAEAEVLLPAVQVRAALLGKELDQIRVVWLEGQVAAGLGRTEEAVAVYERVREEFLGREMAYDYALATLELAALHLEHGRNTEVVALGEQMFWVFGAQGVHREALAALELFRQAVEREEATPELARRIAGYLTRARHDPHLRFEG